MKSSGYEPDSAGKSEGPAGGNGQTKCNLSAGEPDTADLNKSLCSAHCNRCGDVSGRFSELFAAVDIRLSVGFWLGLILPILLSLVWLPGEMRYFDNDGLWIARLHVGILSAMSGPLLLVLLGLVLSVYSGTLNLAVWGIAAISCVWFRYLYHLSDNGELAGILVLLLSACLGTAMFQLKSWCRCKAVVLSLVIGLVCNLIAVYLPDAAEIQVSWLTSPFLAIELSVLGLIFILGALGFSRGLVKQGSGEAVDAGKITGYKGLLFIGSYLCAALGGCIAGFSGEIVGSGGLFGDMRVLAAASLCIIPLNRGRAAVIFSCLLAPVSLLTANMWLLCVGSVFGRVSGTLAMLVMAVMIFGVRLIALGRGGRRQRRFAAFLAALGVITVALGAYWPVEPAAANYLYAGLCLWLAGFAIGLARLIRIIFPRSAALQ